MADLLNEFMHEITGKPTVFIGEIIQFLVFIGIFTYALPKVLGKKLKERRDGIDQELQMVKGAPKRYSDAEKEAEIIIAKAKEQASHIIDEAKQDVETKRKATIVKADKEVDQVFQQAKHAIKTEKNNIISHTCEQLVSLVSETTREFMDEALSNDERQALTEKIIQSRFEEILMPAERE